MGVAFLQCENMVVGEKKCKEMEVVFLECENMVTGKEGGKETEVAFSQCKNTVVGGKRWQGDGGGRRQAPAVATKYTAGIYSPDIGNTDMG